MNLHYYELLLLLFRAYPFPFLAGPLTYARNIVFPKEIALLLYSTGFSLSCQESPPLSSLSESKNIVDGDKYDQCKKYEHPDLMGGTLKRRGDLPSQYLFKKYK